MHRIGLMIGFMLFWLAWPAYQVYFRRGGRTRVLLVCGDRILLLKGWINDGMWNLAGGGLHPGEDVVAGAVRETNEETGIALNASELVPLGQAVYKKAGLRFDYHMFYAVVPETQALHLQRHEIAAFRWVSVAEIETVPVSQEVIACLTAARRKRLLQ